MKSMIVGPKIISKHDSTAATPTAQLVDNLATDTKFVLERLPIDSPTNFSVASAIPSRKYADIVRK